MWQAIRTFLGASLGKAGAFTVIKVWQVALAATIVTTGVAGTFTYFHLRQSNAVSQHVLVFIGGMNTDMKNCQSDTFNDLLYYLVNETDVTGPYADGCNVSNQSYLQSSSSLAFFSYTGGVMDPQHGVWLPNDYNKCDADDNRLQQDIQTFDKMLNAYRQVYPAATFTIVGHSLGGLIALQGAYDYAIHHHSGSIDKVITVDAPLEGIFDKKQEDNLIQTFSKGCTPFTISGGVVTQDLLPLGKVSFVSPVCTSQQQETLSQCKARALTKAGVEVITLGNRQDSLFCQSFGGLLEKTCDTQVLLSELSTLKNFYNLPSSDLIAPGHGTILSTPSAEQDIIRYILAPSITIDQPTAQSSLLTSTTGTALPYFATVHCLWGTANHATAQLQMNDGTQLFAGTAVPTNTSDTLVIKGIAYLPTSYKNATGTFYIEAGGNACDYPSRHGSPLKASVLPTDKDYLGGKISGLQFTLNTGSSATQISGSTSKVQPSNVTDDAVLLARSSGLTVPAGQSFTVYFDYENSGNTTWTDTNGYQLVCDTKSVPEANCMGGKPQGLNGIAVPAGSQSTFYVTLTAPIVAGTYQLAWKMADNATTFGQSPTLLQIKVTPSPMAFLSFNNNIYALNSLNGTQLWHFQAPGNNTTFSLTSGNGLIYFCSYNSVYALDMKTAKPRWQFEVEGTSSGSLGGNCLMLENGTVYVFDTNGIVYALNANQGALLWRYKYTTDALQSGGTTTVSNGTVYVGSNTDEVYAINANNGSLLWRVQTDSAPSWITEGNGIAFVATSYPNYPSLQTLYAFRASDGTELWHYDITNPGNDNIPIVGNGMVFVGTLDNVYALDINSGAQRWQRNAEIVNTMALNHGILYVSYQSGGLDALDAKSGTRIWNFSAPGYIVFVTGTQVYYVYGFDGALGKAYVLDADTARLLWSYQARNYNNPSGTSLGIDAVANGQVYVDDLRYVYAFSASDGTPLWVFDSGQFQSYFINVIVS